MKKNAALLLFSILLCGTRLLAQSYKLTVLQGQVYTELSAPDYEIPQTSPLFGNVNTKPDMRFDAFGKQYDLSENIFVPIKEGYAYMINDTRSVTLYAGKGSYDGRAGAASTPAMSVWSFKRDTTGPEEKFVMQWKNMGFEGEDSAYYINFQLSLHAETGIIEMHFGTNKVKDGLWENNKNGPTIGLLEMDDQFSTIYNQLWLSGNASSPVINTSSSVIQLNDVPSDGTVYRFTPKSTGIAQLDRQSTGLFPTVIGEEKSVKISGIEAAAFSYEIMDLSGRSYAAEAASGDQIMLPGLKAGVYVVSIIQEGRISLHKIVKL